MSVQTFQNYLKENNIDIEVEEFNQTTHTAEDASKVYGIPVCNIVKSLLVFVDSEYCLFLVPGDRRLDLNSIKKRFNAESVRMANASEVKDITGYSIGGVPPFGHKSKIKTYIEDGFNNEDFLVAAAGSSNSVFRITLKKLEELCK